MRLFATSAAFIAPFLLLTSMSVQSMDLNLSLQTASALTIFTDGDWDIMKENARTVLNDKASNNAQQWVNPETGHSGSIKALSTSTIEGRLCRKAQFTNIAGDATSTTLVNLCQQDDKWFVETAPTTETIQQGNSTPWDGTTLSDGAVTSKKVMSRTSERCRELSHNIDSLKGSPLRRSAAIDLHKAECLN